VGSGKGKRSDLGSRTLAPPALARSIRERAGSYHHPVGTCAMGPNSDAGAVVDARGAVHGIDGLWVVDASVMPTIPTANTNLSTIVVADLGRLSPLRDAFMLKLPGSVLR